MNNLFKNTHKNNQWFIPIMITKKYIMNKILEKENRGKIIALINILNKNKIKIFTCIKTFKQLQILTKLSLQEIQAIFKKLYKIQLYLHLDRILRLKIDNLQHGLIQL